MPPEDRILWLVWSLCWNDAGEYWYWDEINNSIVNCSVNLDGLKIFLRYRKDHNKKEDFSFKHDFKKGDIDKLKEIIFKFELMGKE